VGDAASVAGAKFVQRGSRCAHKVKVSIATIKQLKHAREAWRPPLDQLPPARLTALERVWLIVLRFYLIVAGRLVLVRIVMLALSGA
jgi:hypothetical protein